jgi:hypothetical protein
VRAVLDPNVLVSAAISPAGPPRQILTAWPEFRSLWAFGRVLERVLLVRRDGLPGDVVGLPDG